MQISVNGKSYDLDVEPDMPVLWVLRDVLGMTGTKFGCGMGLCGACTIHLDGMPTRCCVLPVSAVVGSEIRTIEGLNHPVQKAWLTEQVPQCGYCQSGQLMMASGLLDQNPNPSDADIAAAMTNLCRCATYARIRKGIHTAAKDLTPAVAPVAPAAPEGSQE